MDDVRLAARNLLPGYYPTRNDPIFPDVVLLKSSMRPCEMQRNVKGQARDLSSSMLCK